LLTDTGDISPLSIRFSKNF